MLLPSKYRRPLFLVPIFASVAIVGCWWKLQNTDYFSPLSHHTKPFCANLPGAEDVLVIMKTGATEANRKLPVHFSTTFQCTHNYVIFSDMKGKLAGYEIHDALASVNQTIKATHSDFEIYRMLNQNPHQPLEGHKGQYSKLAWTLDKWKFMPLVDEALAHMPTAKWYVFIEADTYLVWSNLLQWLQKFDASQDLYLGGQTNLGDLTFAHGGTGYVLSNSAVRKVVADRAVRLHIYDAITDTEFAGDVVLGLALKNLGISLTQSWPMAQGETPSSLDYTGRHWCYPVISYHHMSTPEIEIMWKFEQNWLLNTNRHEPILHRDVFNGLIESKMQLMKSDWNNISRDQEDSLNNATLGTCRRACEQKQDCMQFSLVDAECKTAAYAKLGRRKAIYESEAQSGWMLDRIADFKTRLEMCTPVWILK